jgi:hypothetical protein
VDKNLIVADEVMRDMVSYTQALGDQIEDFILLLAENAFAPSILESSTDYHDGSFSHRLPSGCIVFWEILETVVHPRFGTLDGVFVRVTGARFDFGAR